VSASPDLRGHGILEAHAGTGKTWTIVRIVLRLLVEEHLDLRQILLVTFTQKAAGELVGRIREGIAETIEKTPDPAVREHLRRSLAQLGECWIGTIHGVSLRILRAWPFESSLPFRTTLVDDDEGLEAALRTVWRANPWNLADDELERLWSGRPLGALLTRAQELARGRLDPDMVLLPAETTDPDAFERLRHDATRLATAVERSRIPLERAEADFLPWLAEQEKALAALPTAGFGKGLAEAVARSLDGWRRMAGTRSARSEALVRGTKGKNALPEKMGARDRKIDEALEAERLWTGVVSRWNRDLAELVESHAQAAAELATLPDRQRALLLSQWADRAAAAWKVRKAAEGSLSYQDMLERLRDALAWEPFRSALRARIRVGIIDEFQDTSALQWDIFRRWFVDDNPAMDPRLFLVGDPKQSIYSFQGADVRTYLQACRDLAAAGARTYPLRTNWRSAPGLIHGVNDLLVRDSWFGDEIAYRPEAAVQPAPRAESAAPAANDRLGAPVQLVRVEGAASHRRAAYAATVARAILEHRGRRVALPEGPAWKDHVLDWGDFAVIVQTRSSVPAFRRAFRDAGIPWALYKEQGVFASRAAAEFRCLLAAIAEPGGRDALKSRALLTRFFGVALESLDPARHLGPTSTATAVFERLADLAASGRWARLFHAILHELGAQERILDHDDGDRHWMDLRQTMDHALEFLVLGQGALPELVEHLERLERGEERVAEDRNLHARATDRARVQILTMHVSKGLEFPVVFLSTASRRPARGEVRWIAPRDGRLRLHLSPKEIDDGQLAKRQAEEETSRLLYVALTRPKLLLVAPVHLDPKGKAQDTLSERVLERGPDLPPHLAWRASQPLPEAREPDAADDRSFRRLPALPRARVTALRLGPRTRFLSSYSAVSKSGASHGLDGRIERSEEIEPPRPDAALPVPPGPASDAWLPRGAATGDCLHELLEDLLGRPDLSWCPTLAIPAWFQELARRTLPLHGLDPALAPRVAALLANLLGRPLPLPSGATVRLCDLPPVDRRPEVEFHCALDESGRILSGSPEGAPDAAGWLVGYIDLLFRHDGAWHVLDWKTTTLPGYDPPGLDDGMTTHDYRLQSALYGQVVRTASRGAFGGAVYVFLRALAGADDPASEAILPGVWTSPEAREHEPGTRERLARWIHLRRNPSRFAGIGS